MQLIFENFLSDCASIATEPDAHKGISNLVSQAVSEPNSLYNAIGTPSSAKIEKLSGAKNLTILNVVWAPRMTLLPHNHNMWAVIGVYCGREDNIFWRRISGDDQGKIEAVGAKSIGPGEVQVLGKDIIHSVTNPTANFTGAIHVYGGDFFEKDRSEWNPETLEEKPYDVNKNIKYFEDANSFLRFQEKLKNNA